MSKFEVAEQKEVCKLEKPIEKSNNVDNEEMKKSLIRLVGAVKEVVFLLKCIIFLVVFLWIGSLSEELVKVCDQDVI